MGFEKSCLCSTDDCYSIPFESKVSLLLCKLWIYPVEVPRFIICVLICWIEYSFYSIFKQWHATLLTVLTYVQQFFRWLPLYFKCSSTGFSPTHFVVYRYGGHEEGLWLHCVRYTGPDWTYECPFPDWAKLDWFIFYHTIWISYTVDCRKSHLCGW